MRAMSVYDRLPVFAQNMAFSYMGSRIQKTRFGAGFHSMLDKFESHENWSKDKLLSWRNSKMQEMVKHCYQTVPYYRAVMDEGGINPESVKTADDLKLLPVIRKDDVKANPSAFLSSEASGMRLLHVHTSGTTGSGFQFESTVECQQAQFACFWRYYKKHGLDFDTWQAQFSSRQAVPQRVTKPPFWRIDKPGKRYYMSAFHESSANMRAYYEVICENRFPWISGYPSLMVLLSQWMNERDLHFDFVRAVTCGAENLLDHQNSSMERAFGVQPVQTYGQTENVAIFSTDPDGRVLVDEDFSVVEFEPSESFGGGVSCYWLLSFQLRNSASPIRYGRHRRAWGSFGKEKRGRLDRRQARGLYRSSRWYEDWQARPRFQRHASFQRSSNCPSERLLSVPQSCRGAVSMRRGREESSFGASAFGRRINSRAFRILHCHPSNEVSEASLRRVGGE